MTEVTTQQSITLPELAEGELNGGLAFVDGKPSHWVILLPGDKAGADHDSQLAWAHEVEGADLPSPEEQSLLRAHLPGEFKADWYWSNKKRGSGSAWYTYFYDGCQDSSSEYGKLRARRVRRSFI